MYSIVMAMALTGSMDVPDFGGRSRCCGCSGGYSCGGCKGCSCRGGRRCHGRSRCCGCTGYVVCCGAPVSYGCGGCAGGYGGCAGGYQGQPGYQQGSGQQGEQVGPPKKKKTTPQEQVSATIVVSLPVDARLTVDGQSTKSASATRVFTTPPLQAGERYQYVLRAEVMRDGAPLAMTRTVNFGAGEEARVTFDFGTATVSLAR